MLHIRIGTTPLFYAAQSGNLDAVVYLHLKAKASLTDTTSEGWAPVHVAAQAGHINILDVRVVSIVYGIMYFTKIFTVYM